MLDEATAEAGSAGARVLEKAIETTVEGRTALVVAHRLTQAAATDRVVVMDGGRIVEKRLARRAALLRRPVRLLWEAWSGVRPTSSDHHPE